MRRPLLHPARRDDQRVRRDLTDLAIDGLACARLTRLAIRDEITEPLRAPVRTWATRRKPPTGADVPTSSIDLLRYPVAHPKIAYLLDCPWCMSAYAAVVVIWLRRTKIGPVVLRLLALSEVTGVTEMTLGRLTK